MVELTTADEIYMSSLNGIKLKGLEFKYLKTDITKWNLIIFYVKDRK